MKQNEVQFKVFRLISSYTFIYLKWICSGNFYRSNRHWWYAQNNASYISIIGCWSCDLNGRKSGALQFCPYMHVSCVWMHWLRTIYIRWWLSIVCFCAPKGMHFRSYTTETILFVNVTQCVVSLSTHTYCYSMGQHFQINVCVCVFCFMYRTIYRIKLTTL